MAIENYRLGAALVNIAHMASLQLLGSGWMFQCFYRDSYIPADLSTEHLIIN